MASFAAGGDRRAALSVILNAFHRCEAHMTLGRLISHVMTGLAVLFIASAIFATLANVGLISRPSSENVSFGG